MANHWDPITSRRLSEQTGLAQNQISPQLDRLRKFRVCRERPPLRQCPIRLPDRRAFLQYLVPDAQLLAAATAADRIPHPVFGAVLQHAGAARSYPLIHLRVRPVTGPNADRARRRTLRLGDPTMKVDMERRLELDALQHQYTEARRQLMELIDFDAIPPATLAFSELRTRLVALAPNEFEVTPDAFADDILSSRRMFMYHEREKLATQERITPEQAKRILSSINSEKWLDINSFGDQAVDWVADWLKTGQICALDDLEDWNRTILAADLGNDRLFWLLLDTMPDSLKRGISDVAFKQIRSVLRPKADDSDRDSWYTWAQDAFSFRYGEAEDAYRRALDIRSAVRSRLEPPGNCPPTSGSI